MTDDQRPRQQLTVAQQRALEVERGSGAIMDSVENNRGEVSKFLKGFGIEYDFFVSGLKVFLMRQAQTQPDFFTDVKMPTFMEALFRCAKDGLIPDGKEAAIGAFKGVATYMPMRDGLVKVLWRTGMIRDINDQVVTRMEYESGNFEYQEGDGGFIRHRPSLDRKDTDEVVAAYCVVNFTNGGSIREVVGKADLTKIAAMSRSPARANWANQMHRKAAIRRIMGKMPRTPEITQLLAHDDVNYDLNVAHPPEPSGVRERLPGKVEGEGFAHHKVEEALIRRPKDIDAILEGDSIPEGCAATSEPEAPVSEPVNEDILQWAADFNGSLVAFTSGHALKARWDAEIENRKKLADESPGLARSLKDAVAARLKELGPT